MSLDITEKKFYFAYGSNLSHRQMGDRCPGAEPVGGGRLEGHRLTFASYSERWGGAVADIRKEDGSFVDGGIYEVDDTHIESLDGYEGYPNFYSRDEVDVRLDDDRIVRATVYMMAKVFDKGEPSSSYIKIIIEGCKDFGIKLPSFLF